MKQKITHQWIVVTLAVFAGVLTIGLTGVAFWLSYEHLHDVAGAHGLSPVSPRSWAWPATLDTFIIIGEVLILRASLLGKTDWWAFTLAAVGSGGSITLNVVGVGGQAGALDYTVAAVPPVAALFAFGALMRQLHGVIQGYLADSVPEPVRPTPVVPPPVPASRPTVPEEASHPRVPAPPRPTPASQEPRPNTEPSHSDVPATASRPKSRETVPDVPPEDADLLTTSQAAGLARVVPRVVRNWKNRGRLVPVVWDPDVLYSRESVLARMAEVSK